MNLKYHYPVIVFAVAFSAVVYFSFKHSRPPEAADGTAASVQERLDQIGLSSSHEYPAPLSTAAMLSSSPTLAPGINASVSDLAQLRTLDQILAAKNDNDPRLDKELRALSPVAKTLMRNRYDLTATEKRNQRGTIVYLVGRELSSADDVGFLHSVLTEPPCLSLSNCGAEDKASMASDDHHHDSMNEVTLAYPQIVALKSIEAFLSRPGASELTAPLLAVLEAARRSSVRKVASLADEIYKKVSGSNN